MKKIEFFRHSLDEDDIRSAVNVLHSIFLTTGGTVLEFEQNFARYIGAGHAVGVTSCTAALHLSLLALGIGPGDEVITTPMSFCATANSILHAGAVPVFVDVEESTGNLDANLVEKAITPRTKAIIPVHLYGQLCDMKRLREIADRHGLKIIEDAAHAIESSRDGIRVGQLGDTACFSFYATKNITSGEGGAITTSDAGLADTLKMLRSHGIDRAAADRYTKRYQHWDMPILGWKYNMDNIQAALLIGQLARIESLWEERRRCASSYETLLQNLDGIGWFPAQQHSKHAYHLFTVLAPAEKRDSLLWAMQDRRIGVAVNYRPIHLLSYYRKTFGYSEGSFPVAEEIGSRTISLPLYPSLSDGEIKTVVTTLGEELSK